MNLHILSNPGNIDNITILPHKSLTNPHTTSVIKLVSFTPNIASAWSIPDVKSYNIVIQLSIAKNSFEDNTAAASLVLFFTLSGICLAIKSIIFLAKSSTNPPTVIFAAFAISLIFPAIKNVSQALFNFVVITSAIFFNTLATNDGFSATSSATSSTPPPSFLIKLAALLVAPSLAAFSATSSTTSLPPILDKNFWNLLPAF